MTKDLNFSVEVIGCPIVREADGLAKSSRNKNMTPEERKAAPALNHALQATEAAMLSGTRDSGALRRIVEERLAAEPLLRIDYIEIVDALSLRPVEEVRASTLLAAAVYLSKTRIIDNRLLERELV